MRFTFEIHPKIQAAIFISGFLFFCGIMWFVPREKHDPCEYIIAIYSKNATGIVIRVDSSRPGRGVWTFVRNQQLKEQYDFDTYEAVRKATVGDSIYKPSESYYGWLIKANGTRTWIKLQKDEWSECDNISQERIQKILQIKDYFKDD
jgi:hypothetical protein